MWKQPGHLTSMKKLLGDCISLFSLCFRFSSLVLGNRRSCAIVLSKKKNNNKQERKKQNDEMFEISCNKMKVMIPIKKKTNTDVRINRKSNDEQLQRENWEELISLVFVRCSSEEERNLEQRQGKMN